MNFKVIYFNVLKMIRFNRKANRNTITYPNIAQLAERPTVEGMWWSGGPWFDSECSDDFYFLFFHFFIFILNIILSISLINSIFLSYQNQS